MEGVLSKWILTSISVVLFASLISLIAWTVMLGYGIAYDLQDGVIVYYSEAGLSMMVNANNLESIDSANLYKVMESNRNVITDFKITNLDGSIIYDTRELLNRPTDRFNVVIRGDSSTGFEVTATEVEVHD